MENTIRVQRAGVRQYDHVLLVDPLVRCLHTAGAQPVFSLWRCLCCWHREQAPEGLAPSKAWGLSMQCPCGQSSDPPGSWTVCPLLSASTVLCVLWSPQGDGRASRPQASCLSLNSHCPGDLTQWPMIPQFLPPTRLSAQLQRVSTCFRHIFISMSNRTL